MNTSSIRNAPIKIIRNDMNSDDENVCAKLSEATYTNKSSAELLQLIENHLATLGTDNKKKISFLEQAYSSCDVVQPFGRQPKNIVETLNGIKNKIESLNKSYFQQIASVFDKIDIKAKIDEEVFKLNDQSDIDAISKKLQQEINSKIYIKKLTQQNNNTPSNSNSNSSQNNIISFGTGSKYTIEPTSSNSNDCLIYAINKGAVSDINRGILFSKKNIELQLHTMYDATKSAYMTTEENFSAFKQMVIGVYNEVQEINHANRISDIASILSNHIKASNCFLDGQLAASVLANQLQHNIVIISPNTNNKSGFSYKVITQDGIIQHNGKLDTEALKSLETQDNTIFIYNHNGYHFEWLKKVTI